MTTMLVLIAGITGKLGSRLAVAAQERGLQVRGLGRNPANLGPEISEKLESFVTSTSYYDIPALERAVAGVDAVICAYSPTPILNLEGDLLLLRAAERAGIKIYIASSWNNDWSRLKHGDLETYDPHIAFQQHVAMTSSIRPVYIFTGTFMEYLFSPYGPGMFDQSSGTATMRYWGDGKNKEWSWTAMGDAAAWSIEILLHGNGVQEGQGGYFRFRSGAHSIEQLAAIYEAVKGTKVDVIREGSLEELELVVSVARKEKGRSRFWEYLPLARSLVGTKGLWDLQGPTSFDHVKKATALEEFLREEQM